MREAIQEYLELRGFRATAVGNGDEMKAAMAVDPADLVLLDLSMPGKSEIELTKELKSSSSVGVIIVIAHGDSEYRVLGLESGADDYIVKPFNFRELLARVHSVLRRIENTESLSTTDDHVKRIQIGEWIFECGTETLSKMDGTMAVLTTGELDLLVAFIDSANNPVSRDELAKVSSHWEWGPLDRSVGVKIARLRRKIETDPSKPKLIKAVRNVGYVLNATPL